MNKRIIAAIYALTFVFGACDEWFADAPPVVNQVLLWLSIISVSLLIFAWVHLDAKSRHYQKSKWMNLGVLALAVVCVPIYLFRSRPKGRRLQAFGGLLLALLGYFAIGYAGSLFAFEFPL